MLLNFGYQASTGTILPCTVQDDIFKHPTTGKDALKIDLGGGEMLMHKSDVEKKLVDIDKVEKSGRKFSLESEEEPADDPTS